MARDTPAMTPDLAGRPWGGPSSHWWTLVIVSLLLITTWAVGSLLASTADEELRAVAMLSALALVSLGLFWVVVRTEPPGSRLLIVIWTSFALKLAAMAYRYYSGLLADANTYDLVGRIVAERLARGEWERDSYLGSQFIRLATGMVYLMTGPTFSGISILWTWLGLLGMLFFYLSFRTAIPAGNRHLYLLLIFLYPSMLLWTSSLGKDALVILFLGMATYGVARVHRRVEPIGLWWLLLGMSGVAMIRPHIAAVFAVAFGASRLLGRIGSGPLGPAIRIFEVAVLVVVAAVAIGRAGTYAGLEEVGPEGVFEFISGFQEESARGGSAFEQVDTTSPAGLALAVPTILFRPFPWEAHNVNAIIASMEGIGLLVITLFRWRSIVATVRAARRDAMALFLCVFAALFMFLFTAIGNFGIIARQRASQLFPFFFMMVAYSDARSASPERRDGDDARG